MVNTFVLDSTSITIPAWVQDLNSFRHWLHSDESPECGQICYLNGEVWVDMSKEQFTHNQVKGEFNSVLMPLAKRSRSGRFFPDGYLLTNSAANLSTNPDGMFVSMASLRAGRVRLVSGAEEGFTELQGTPDMVLEIVSPSSVHKDTVVLLDLYWQAGISEYWLVDVRGERPRFDILRHDRSRYVPTRKQAGWVKSRVFGQSFRLTQEADALGHPEFTLEVR
jgi:Uma2 family endonuclease